MKNLLAFALVLACSVPAGAFAACSKQAAPTVPDGKTASEADMGAAQGAIKAYMASTNAYLQCLDAEGKAAGAAEPKTAKVARTKAYNAAVDEMNTVAGKFNASIKAFKSR